MNKEAPLRTATRKKSLLGMDASNIQSRLDVGSGVRPKFLSTMPEFKDAMPHFVSRLIHFEDVTLNTHFFIFFLFRSL